MCAAMVRQRSRRKSRSRKAAEVAVKPPSARAAGRYTAPKPRTTKHSALWVPATMFACFLAGMIVIIANFLLLLPGGAQQNSDLLLGLGLLIVGFGLSTRYK
jgi:hypothetical protein